MEYPRILVTNVMEIFVDGFSFRRLRRIYLKNNEPRGTTLRSIPQRRIQRYTRTGFVPSTDQVVVTCITRSKKTERMKQNRIGPVRSASFTRTESILFCGLMTTRILLNMWLKSIPSSNIWVYGKEYTFKKRRFIVIVLFVHGLHISKSKIIIIIVVLLYSWLDRFWSAIRWKNRHQQIRINAHPIILKCLTVVTLNI